MLKRVAFLACSLMAVLCAACSTGGGTNGSHSTMLPAIAEPVRQAESAANDTAGLADVISIDAGGGAAVSNFVADTDYVGGTTSYPLGAGVVIDTSAANAAPAQLYRTTRESAGSFSYVIKANFVPNQPSVLRLHFAEVFGLKAAQRQSTSRLTTPESSRTSISMLQPATKTTRPSSLTFRWSPMRPAP